MELPGLEQEAQRKKEGARKVRKPVQGHTAIQQAVFGLGSRFITWGIYSEGNEPVSNLPKMYQNGCSEDSQLIFREDI